MCTKTYCVILQLQYTDQDPNIRVEVKLKKNSEKSPVSHIIAHKLHPAEAGQTII